MLRYGNKYWWVLGKLPSATSTLDAILIGRPLRVKQLIPGLVFHHNKLRTHQTKLGFIK